MTKQQIFNKVAKHFRKQKVQAVIPAGFKEGVCVYRGKDGLRCAVGCLITDVEYKVSMEYRGVYSLVMNELSRFKSHLDLLKELQHCHDSYGRFGLLTSATSNNMKKIAKEFKLSAKEVTW